MHRRSSCRLLLLQPQLLQLLLQLSQLSPRGVLHHQVFGAKEHGGRDGHGGRQSHM